MIVEFCLFGHLDIKIVSRDVDVHYQRKDDELQSSRQEWLDKHGGNKDKFFLETIRFSFDRSVNAPRTVLLFR